MCSCVFTVGWTDIYKASFCPSIWIDYPSPKLQILLFWHYNSLKSSAVHFVIGSFEQVLLSYCLRVVTACDLEFLFSICNRAVTPTQCNWPLCLDTSKCHENCRLGMSDTGLNPISDAKGTGWGINIQKYMDPALQTSSVSQKDQHFWNSFLPYLSSGSGLTLGIFAFISNLSFSKMTHLICDTAGSCCFYRIDQVTKKPPIPSHGGHPALTG